MSAPTQAPIKPQPLPITLDPATTAIGVLDLGIRCDDPDQVCSLLIPALGQFLERARAAGVPIIYTNGASAVGTSLEPIATGLQRREDEPVIFPNAFDKFMGGELLDFLSAHHSKNFIIVGSSTHVCVLYTATTAARIYRMNVVIPLDGVNTKNEYEHDWALHQLQVIPLGDTKPKFTTFELIDFS